MKKEDYKTSEQVDMKDELAVKFAADQLGINVSQYKACAEAAATYSREGVRIFVQRRFDRSKGCCW